MARKTNPREKNPYIVVFWEGESEELYMKYMKREFRSYANLTVNKQRGIFQAANKAILKEKGVFFSDRKEIDEVWFVFDTEPDLRGKWEEYEKIVRALKKIQKELRVRLLMTKGCIEYYFLLHFQKCRPTILTPTDKEQILKSLVANYVPNYQKGDADSIDKIAAQYTTAVINGHWSLEQAISEIGIVSEERDRQLFMTDSTFTTVQEGIEFLIELKNKKQSGKN